MLAKDVPGGCVDCTYRESPLSRKRALSAPSTLLMRRRLLPQSSLPFPCNLAMTGTGRETAVPRSAPNGSRRRARHRVCAHTEPTAQRHRYRRSRCIRSSDTLAGDTQITTTYDDKQGHADGFLTVPTTATNQNTLRRHQRRRRALLVGQPRARDVFCCVSFWCTAEHVLFGCTLTLCNFVFLFFCFVSHLHLLCAKGASEASPFREAEPDRS